MKSIRLLSLLCLIMTATGLLAQNPPAPKAPLVRHTPAFASWTETFTYTSKDPSKPDQSKTEITGRRIQSITITKTNKTYWEQTLWSTGEKDDKWIFEGNQLESVNNGKSILMVAVPTPEDPSPDYLDYTRNDFPELEWVSLANYKGIDATRGFHFEKGDKEAFLSVKEQMPQSFRDGVVSCTYTYNPPPVSPLTPPERFLSVIQTHKHGVEAQKYHPSLP